MNFSKNFKNLFFLSSFFLFTTTSSFASSFQGLKHIIETISNAATLPSGESAYGAAHDALASFKEHLPHYEKHAFKNYQGARKQLTKSIALIRKTDATGTTTKPWHIDSARKEIGQLIAVINDFSSYKPLSKHSQLLVKLYDDMQAMHNIILNPSYITVGNRFERIANSIWKHKARTALIVATASIAFLAGKAYWQDSSYESKKLKFGSNYQSLAQKNTTQLPIVFHPEYDISFGGIENLHPFDSKKYGKVHRYLKNTLNISDDAFHQPPHISRADLELVHTPKYLDSLRQSKNVARITELPFLALVPNILIRKHLLKSMEYATSGTILAAFLAQKKGWAINLSGGYHHAKADSGGGFCVYADINIAAKKLWEKDPDLNIMVIDLDAHQGNGHEDTFKKDKRVSIFDMYNGSIYPQDTQAQRYITSNHPLPMRMGDKKYLKLLKAKLPNALKKEKPQFIIYNAGTDIFEKDPLGGLRITANGIKQRDAFVFEQAQKNSIPILMVLSGGYTKESAKIIGESIENVVKNVLKVKTQ